ncbi:MAG: VWA domain-containing protein [Lachnospiraceae bacterium]|nr:VWA domain-containing protein [Lachnospiraceae bacterium]
MKLVLRRVLTVIMVLSLIMVKPLQTKAEGNEETTECNVISIAIDVSGSMKKTDSHRHSIELIKLCMDICNETDYLSVTAYNDQIVYHSGLVSMGNAEGKNKLVEELDALQFRGETDNGLGLLKATNAIVEAGLEYDNAFIIMISDGNTDLENSKTNRTTADSDADMETSTQLAIDNDIMINVVGYTDAYNQDTGLLSVVSASTGGSTTIVNNATQFVQVVLGTFFYGYEHGKANFQASETTEIVNRYETHTEVPKNQKCYEVLFSTEPMSDCEVVNVNEGVQVFRGKNYLIQRMDEEGQYDFKAIYSLEKTSTLISGTVRVQKKEPVVAAPVPTAPPVVEDLGKAPKGQNVEKQMYTSKEAWVMDVSSLFEDEDGDIVKYSVTQNSGEAECTLSGSMLSVTIDKAGKNEYLIVAEDSKQNKKEIALGLEIVPAWKQYQGLLTIILVCGILLVAGVICAYIIKAVLFGGKKTQNAISGSIKAYFIDLKSKNESVDLLWDLEDYPPEGVTLEELFLSKGIKESFKDIEKVCFYPGKNTNELLLVHCMEGGIFLGDQNVKANKPITISSGDILYISFAENASEIEMKYTAKSDCLNR